jgi:putative transposase
MKQGKAMGKQALADALGVNHNSAQRWKQRYEQSGIDCLLEDRRGGYKPSVIDEDTAKAIQIKLSNATQAPRSYKELQQWVHEHYINGIKYSTLNSYVKRKWKAKLKVARKSHIKKSEQAVEVFKKNR